MKESAEKRLSPASDMDIMWTGTAVLYVVAEISSCYKFAQKEPNFPFSFV